MTNDYPLWHFYEWRGVKGERCNVCVFHSQKTDTCDYYLLTHERRPCTPQKCSVYLSADLYRRCRKMKDGITAKDGDPDVASVD